LAVVLHQLVAHNLLAKACVCLLSKVLKMQPFDYRQQVANPFEQALGSAMQGFQLGATVRETQAKQQMAAQAQQRQQQLMDQFARLQEKPDRSWEDYESIANLLPKDQAEALRKNYEVLSTERQEAAKRFSGQVVAALTSPNPEAQQRGIELLRRRAEAERNSGNTDEAEAYELHARIAESEGGTRVVADEIMTYGTSVFGKDWADGILKIRETPDAGFRPITAEERRQFGLPADVPFQVSPKGEIKEVGRGPMVQVAVDTGSRFGPVQAGMERYTDDAGVVRERVIPGSQLERQMMAEASQAEGRQEQLERAGGTVVQDLTRALNIVQRNPSATGRTASITLALPEVARAETDVQAAKAFVESALSNVGLDTLQRMRENSPTGGALGQVPIQQQQRLEQVLGSLDLTQRKEVVEDNLKRVVNIYMDIIHGSPQSINQRFERGEITRGQKEALSFRHQLSFDELGNPIRNRGRRRNVPQLPEGSPTPAAPAQGGVRFLGFE
jgi:hypothetical protein